MSIKIIGAGFPRTGTNTLRESLQKLGYVQTYHMKELLVHPQNLHYWTTLKKTGTTKWDELYDGFQATVDFPCYPWYKEHMKRYPDAKVILTVRPFDKWYSSVYSTIWQAQHPPVLRKLAMMPKLLFSSRLRSVIKCVKFAKEAMMDDHFQGKFENKAFAEKVFNKHIEDVKAYVPAEKLLVFDVTEGWGPLCKFLHVSLPNEPLPHTNKKEDFKIMLGELMKGNLV